MGRPRTRSDRAGHDRAEPAGQLSLTEIVTAALELTQKVGVDGFTMRDLAERLVVSPASLYHYVPSKRRLKEHLADEVAGRMASPEELQGSWDEKLRTMLIRQHLLLREYPGVALLYIRERPTPGMLRIIDGMLQLLLSTGISSRDALRCFEALIALAFGQQVTELRHPRSGDDVRVRLGNVTRADRERLPGLAALEDELASAQPEDYFEHSVDLLLAGIREYVGLVRRPPD
jgi:AcrR family transcriptional regulator